MAEAERIETTNASIIISVDHLEGGDLSGHYRYVGREMDRPFPSLAGLILDLDCAMDDFGKPQSSTERKSWYDPREKVPHAAKLLWEQPETRRGAAATFYVYIYLRQNASWQGEIFWVEKNQRVTFRSVLELMHLMVSACNPMLYRQLGLPEEATRTHSKRATLE